MVTVHVKVELSGAAGLDRERVAALLEAVAEDIRSNEYERAQWAQGEARLSYAIVEDGMAEVE